MARFKLNTSKKGKAKKSNSSNASVRRANQRVRDAKAAGFRTTSDFKTGPSQGDIRASARNLQGGTGALTPESLAQAEAVNLPTRLTPANNIDSGVINAGLATDGMTGGLINIPEVGARAGAGASELAATDFSNQIGKFLGQTSGIGRPDANANENAIADARQQAGVDAAQQEFNRFSNQINTITSQRDAAQIGLEGQGRGITDTIIGGQQAKIGREAAIQALPIQAQLAAAQGNLEQANALMGQLYQAKSADISADLSYRQNLANSVMSVATASQQAILQGRMADNAQTAQTAQQNLAFQRQLSMQALEFGQNGLVTGISAIDPSSPTFEADMAAFTSQLRKPVAASGGISAPTIKSINGVDMQWDATTGTWVDPVSGGAAPQNVQRLASAQANIDTISSVLESSALDSTVGTSFLTRSGKGFLGTAARVASLVGIPTVLGGAKDTLTGEKQNLIGDVKQLQSQLSLDSLINAKANGATFGALSEKELELLSKSATKLSSWEITKDGDTIGYNASETAFKKEMDKINNFAKLDYMLKGGAPEDIGVQVQPDGTYWVINSDGSYTQLQ